MNTIINLLSFLLPAFKCCCFSCCYAEANLDSTFIGFISQKVRFQKIDFICLSLRPHVAIEKRNILAKGSLFLCIILIQRGVDCFVDLKLLDYITHSNNKTEKIIYVVLCKMNIYASTKVA